MMSKGLRGTPDVRGAPITCPMVVLEVPLRGGKVTALVRFPLDVNYEEISEIRDRLMEQPVARIAL